MFEQLFSYHLEGWSTPSGILSQGQVGIRDPVCGYSNALVGTLIDLLAVTDTQAHSLIAWHCSCHSWIKFSVPLTKCSLVHKFINTAACPCLADHQLHRRTRPRSPVNCNLDLVFFVFVYVFFVFSPIFSLVNLSFPEANSVSRILLSPFSFWLFFFFLFYLFSFFFVFFISWASLILLFSSSGTFQVHLYLVPFLFSLHRLFFFTLL